MRDPRVLSAILCEAIRPELNGKFSLGGVFAGHLKIPAVPAVVVLAIFAEIWSDIVGNRDGEFRAFAKASKKALLTGTFLVSYTAPGAAALAIGPFPISILEPGEILFQWRFGSGEWETIKSVRFEIDPDMPTQMSTTFTGLPQQPEPATPKKPRVPKLKKPKLGSSSGPQGWMGP